MSKEHDEFQRKTWDNHSTGTEIPSLEEESAYDENIQPLMWLIVAQPLNYRGAVLQVTHGIVIGRQGDIRWTDARMSRQHALFSLVPHPEDSKRMVYAITPVNDRNGTSVNGEVITSQRMLEENDEIIMGDTYFIVKVLA
jgi:hypothetical protein